MFFKKKLSPMELKTKLSMAEKKLSKRERMLKDKRGQARMRARDALKNGDERGYRLASKRFGMLEGQLHAISGMVEMATVMIDIVEMQSSMGEIVEIGSMLKGYQKNMGISSEKMQSMLNNLNTSMAKVDQASEMINTTMEMATSGDVTTSESQDSLKAELMAEIEAEETGGTSSLEDRISEAQDDL